MSMKISTLVVAAILAAPFTLSANAEISGDGSFQVAETEGMDRRDDRRDDRQGDRGDRGDTRQDCRGDEGVGKDKRDCKQDGRQDRD
jgi:hypothetical protein